MTTKSKLKKIIPLGFYVLVKVAAEESRENENGLIIPSNVEQEQKSQGTVEAVGEKVENLKPGDEVIFGTYAGEEVKRQENGVEVMYRLLVQANDVTSQDIIAKLQ
jgi:chaperonin GroES